MRNILNRIKSLTTEYTEEYYPQLKRRLKGLLPALLFVFMLPGLTWAASAVRPPKPAAIKRAVALVPITGTAGPGGNIAPTAVSVPLGNTTGFSVVPSAGYTIGSVTGCGVTLTSVVAGPSSNIYVYTTAPVTAPCTVSATFAATSYQVTPSAGTGGTISPSTPQTVNSGSTISFTVTPNTGYSNLDVLSDCGLGTPTFIGNTYTTVAITYNCSVTASFAPRTFTVTSSVGGGGTISPSTPQTVNYNATASFTITPNTGYTISSVTGCGGAISGSTYTTGPITSNCTVSATFNPAACSALSITSPSSLSTGTVGTAYSYQLNASGGQTPYSYSLVSGSIGGLSLSSTGSLSGTPTTAGTYSFTVKVTDSCGAGVQNTQQTVTITVNPAACSALSITSPSSLSTGTVGLPYNAPISASGGQAPYTYSLVSGNLNSSGLILSSTGRITGTPTAAGTYTFTVKVADSCAAGVQNKQQAFTITVNSAACPALSITTASPLSTGTVGQAYSTQVTATGGQTPYTYSLISSALPPGLSLGATGIISGTPTTAGTYSFAINTADSCAAGTQTSQKAYSITINQPAQKATLNITPANFRITLGSSGLQNILYTFTATGPADITLQSSKGVFMAGGSVLGEVNVPLQANIRGGKASVNENLTIPVAISKRAEELKTNKITYVRIFSNSNISLTARAEGVLTTEAGADFSIKRIQLYFGNRRPEATVSMRQPLKAYADLNFTGSGLLRGFWEVDGRVLSTVNTHFAYGATMTLETPDIPALPAFDPGSHIVRFVVTSPSLNITMPEAIYFVTAEEYAGKESQIKLVSPEDKAELAYSATAFTWEGKVQLAAYRIEFLEKGKGSPVFTAYTKTPYYKLPEPALKSIFSPGKDYLWRVKGFAADGSMTGESPGYNFTLTEIHSHLPGQLIVVAEDSGNWGERLKTLEDKYHLSLVETFYINSLRLKVAIFYTKADLFKLVKAVMKEAGIVMVQPNYIFSTMAEAERERQTLSRTLNLGRLHKNFSGRGIIVAVIDTGVDAGHSALKNRVLAFENLLKNSVYSAEIHGTAVAGLIAANSKNPGFEGVAPGAEILALRACKQVSEAQPEGECYTTSIAKALDLAIERKAGIVNMSFGSLSPDSLITRLIEEGSKKGVIFVAPVGNSTRQKNLTFPASHPAVISVAGIDGQGHPYPNADIAAKARLSVPSANIYTTVPGDKFNFISGTSMSSAIVSGILALAIEKNGSVDIHKLPVFNGDICRWNEELLKIDLCGK